MKNLSSLAAARSSVSTRIVVVSLLALLVALVMIGGTLWLSWQLEGGAAAINDAGSLRMRAYKLVLSLYSEPLNSARARADVAQLEETLASLVRGDPARPLVLPGEKQIRQQYEMVSRHWAENLRQQALTAAAGDPEALLSLNGEVDAFVAEINALVTLIEHDNARKTDWLRLSQGVLIVIAIVGTVAMIYLLYLWIIRPVTRLQGGIGQIASQRFDVRLPVESDDEFGSLARGFNAMADELQTVYRDLEQRVRDKTAQLAAQNRELATLYDMAAFLSHPATVEQQCRGFLQRLIRCFDADGGSLRILDPDDVRMHLVVSEGLSETLLNSEQCLHAHECLCGNAVREGVAVMRDFTKMSAHRLYQCEVDGFKGVASFRIAAPQAALGSFALHFRRDLRLSPAEMQLLETLGQQLGTTLGNARLAARERQLAVSEERNLVAQGLHDSIAQSLNFLKLQVQMLERSLEGSPNAEAARILPMLQAGVRESYNDVRELLTNFRTRVAGTEIRQVLQSTVNAFRTQTGIAVEYACTGRGAPLQEEQKLQVLFILQEALSNVRKHAYATNVWISVHNEQDFDLLVRDDGCGFDTNPPVREDEEVKQKVGLTIMQERSRRLAARLDITSAPGHGTSIALHLPRETRLTA